LWEVQIQVSQKIVIAKITKLKKSLCRDECKNVY
jgi:hypothetical protein